ncbi:AraC family transcriptional regulator [Halarcobacter bivalviorum]|uniref:AraC family transcriptional regulator n=1 Tax=Halarcobacter bivalviorum TaxID=663364 RepID=UPI00100A9BFE|nr:AraC family transcriptional regulator [Halarcobacter bivalviorum]RXK08122.1 AraC family transcriptional regulator [Halarcobacter bivalviorum]
MKKDTKMIRSKIVNDTIYFINKNIELNITLEELAHNNSISKYHLHRIFKEETGVNLFEMITSIRLQKAANLLIVNKYSTISEIANACGFNSHSSFIKAFKKKFNFTPKEWKKDGYKKFSSKIIKSYESLEIKEKIEPTIKVCEKIKCLYIRHKGYNEDIKYTWQRLISLAHELKIENPIQIGIQHDNPTITHKNEASYIACIKIDEQKFKNLPILELPSTTCAIFTLKGKYGDVLKYMSYIYNEWLPNSGYEAKTIPSYSIYKKNHFINNNEYFELDFHLPISVIY